jgi:hypothetical protein
MTGKYDTVSDLGGLMVRDKVPTVGSLDIPGDCREQIRKLCEYVAPNEVALAEHAAVIRALGKRVVGDVIEIGRRLADCKALLKEERRWIAWIEGEFSWSRKTAENLINVHAMVRGKVATVATLDINMKSLYLLAQPSTPDEAREAVIEAAADGERLDNKTADAEKLSPPDSRQHFDVVERWTKEARTEEKAGAQDRAYDLHLDCLSQREIATAIGKEFPAFSDVTQQTIGNWANKKTKEFENLSPPDSRQHFDVWSFATADKDAGQQSYFGAVPPPLQRRRTDSGPHRHRLRDRASEPRPARTGRLNDNGAP